MKFTFSHFGFGAALFVLALNATVPAGAQSEDSAYRISAGDIVSVAVYGDEGLSGVFPVAPDGSIAYPILGNVIIGGLTPAEVGEKIDSALAEYIPGLTVTAAISQYAPVFIIGDVQNPGRYEYRPGMIALELVALGGGMRRGSETLDGLQLINAQQEYADLSLQIFGQQVRRARFQAELEDRDFTFPVPDQVDPSVQEIKQRIIEGEERLFEMRRMALESENDALAAQEQSYSDEIETLKASIELHKEELDLLAQDVASTKDLTDRGLTAKSNLRETERRLSSARRDALELGSYLARAQQSQLAFRQRRHALEETRQKEAAEFIQEIELDLARMRARQRSLLDTIAEAALGVQGREAGLAREVTFSVVRNMEGNLREVPVEDRASLKPGDILQVELAPLPGSGEDGSAATSQDTTAGTVRFSSAINQP